MRQARLMGVFCLLAVGLSAGSAQASRAALEVRNNTSGAVCYIYVSPCASDTWGDDILGEETLGPGETATVHVQTGCWDLKAEDCEHDVLANRRGLNVSGDTTWTLSGSAAVARSASVQVRNRSGQTVCYVYVSSCNDDSWGDDILGQDTLATGESAAVTVQNGCWDLKAEDCDHDVIATKRGVQVSGSTTWTLEASAPRVSQIVLTSPLPAASQIAVRNRTSGTVCYVYVSSCNDDSWGDDILGQDTLGPGESASVTVQNGCWDLKAEDCDHEVLATKRGVNVSGNTTWTMSD